MAQVTWLSVALADVQDICGEIAEDSPRAATRLARRFYEAADRLASFPASGRVVPEINDHNFREIIVGNYRLMYSMQPDGIEVWTVIHGARLFSAGDLRRRLSHD